jgi:hypothetical protein
MYEQVVFLGNMAGVRVIDEVKALMSPVSNPSGYRDCWDLPSMIKTIASQMSATLRTPPWRTVTGSSGGLYPLYISADDPYVVYAAVTRQPPPNVMYVLHVGLRRYRRAAEFSVDVRAEIDRRLKVQGWLP